MKIIGAILSIALICSCSSRPDIKTGTELHANFFIDTTKIVE